MNAPATTPQQQALTESLDSPLHMYRSIAVGEESWLHLLWYELCTLGAANLPGMLGFGARALLYPTLLKQCEGRPALGRGIVVRNPRKISLGKKVLVDDYAVLDARGAQACLELGDYVSIGRFTTLAAKGGSIVVKPGANIGSYCRIATQSRVEIGESVLIAAYCYIGPGNHQQDSTAHAQGVSPAAIPLIARPMEIRGGVTLGKHCWIGAHSTILDGVSIGEGAVVGAHSLVLQDVPARSVVAGVPAKIIRQS